MNNNSNNHHHQARVTKKKPAKPRTPTKSQMSRLLSEYQARKAAEALSQYQLPTAAQTGQIQPQTQDFAHSSQIPLVGRAQTVVQQPQTQQSLNSSGANYENDFNAVHNFQGSVSNTGNEDYMRNLQFLESTSSDFEIRRAQQTQQFFGQPQQFSTQILQQQQPALTEQQWRQQIKILLQQQQQRIQMQQQMQQKIQLQQQQQMQLKIQMQTQAQQTQRQRTQTQLEQRQQHLYVQQKQQQDNARLQQTLRSEIGKQALLAEFQKFKALQVKKKEQAQKQVQEQQFQQQLKLEEQKRLYLQRTMNQQQFQQQQHIPQQQQQQQQQQVQQQTVQQQQEPRVLTAQELDVDYILATFGTSTVGPEAYPEPELATEISTVSVTETGAVTIEQAPAVTESVAQNPIHAQPNPTQFTTLESLNGTSEVSQRQYQTPFFSMAHSQTSTTSFGRSNDDVVVVRTGMYNLAKLSVTDRPVAAPVVKSSDATAEKKIVEKVEEKFEEKFEDLDSLFEESVASEGEDVEEEQAEEMDEEEQEESKTARKRPATITVQNFTEEDEEELLNLLDSADMEEDSDVDSDISEEL